VLIRTVVVSEAPVSDVAPSGDIRYSLSARPTVTFPTAQHRRRSAAIRLYCLVVTAVQEC